MYIYGFPCKFETVWQIFTKSFMNVIQFAVWSTALAFIQHGGSLDEYNLGTLETGSELRRQIMAISTCFEIDSV